MGVEYPHGHHHCRGCWQRTEDCTCDGVWGVSVEDDTCEICHGWACPECGASMQLPVPETVGVYHLTCRWCGHRWKELVGSVPPPPPTAKPAETTYEVFRTFYEEDETGALVGTRAYGVFNDLIGETIQNVRVSPERDRLVIVTDEGTHAYEAWAECCATAYIGEMEAGPVRGHTVHCTTEVELEDRWDDEETICTDAHLYDIQTHGGDLSLTMYVEHNGYYAGALRRVVVDGDPLVWVQDPPTPKRYHLTGQCGARQEHPVIPTDQKMSD